MVYPEDISLSTSAFYWFIWVANSSSKLVSACAEVIMGTVTSEGLTLHTHDERFATGTHKSVRLSLTQMRVLMIISSNTAFMPGFTLKEYSSQFNVLREMSTAFISSWNKNLLACLYRILWQYRRCSLCSYPSQGYSHQIHLEYSQNMLHMCQDKETYPLLCIGV